MTNPPDAMRLYSAGSGAARGCGMGCAASCSILPGAVLVLVAQVIPDEAGLVMVKAMMIGLAVFGFGALTGYVSYLAVAKRRSAAWLEGTTLVVRTALRTRRCDLAAVSTILVDSVVEQGIVSSAHGWTFPATRRPIPALRLHDAASGKWVWLLLRSPETGRLLEPLKLSRLAETMRAGQRPDPAAQQRIERIAEGLYQMANDPFADAR